MADINEVPAFPNPGVRLIKEDEHVAIWEEIFEPCKPTPPHRHTRDYLAIFPNAGELTIIPVAGRLCDRRGGRNNRRRWADEGVRHSERWHETDL